MSQPHGAGQCDREIIIIVRWSDGGCFQASAASVWPSGSSPGGSPRPPQARTYHRRALQGCGAFPDRRGCGSNNVRNTGHFFLFSLVPDLDHIGVYVNTRQTERTVEREQRAKKKKKTEIGQTEEMKIEKWAREWEEKDKRTRSVWACVLELI